MRRSPFFCMLFLMLTLLFIMVACSNQSTSNQNSTPMNSEKVEQNVNNNASDSGKADEKKSAAKVQGVTDTEILVGHWSPQTGPVAQYGLIGRGIQSYFNKVNAEGGVNGRKLKLIALDDEYQPSKTVAVAKKLIEDEKVFALIGTTGTPHHKAAMNMIDKVGIPVVGLSTGASTFVNPPKKNWFGLMTNYSIEARILSKYAVETLGAKKIGIFYQNDDFGKDFFNAAKDEISKLHAEIVVEAPYLTTDVDFSSQAIAMKNGNPDVILGFSLAKQTAGFWKELDKIGGKKPFLVTYATGSSVVMFDLAGPIWEGVMSTAWQPTVDDVDNPKIKEYLEQFKKDYPNENPSGYAQWGWADAQVFVEAIKRCGDDLSWDNFISQMESLKEWDGAMAFNVTYSPKNHYGQTSLYIIQAKNKKLERISDIIQYNPAE